MAVAEVAVCAHVDVMCRKCGIARTEHIVLMVMCNLVCML